MDAQHIEHPFFRLSEFLIIRCQKSLSHNGVVLAGRISLQNADVHHVTLSTVNAGIDATLPGTAADYGISTVTSTAIHSLQSAGAARSLNAKTFNGKLDITFAGGQ